MGGNRLQRYERVILAPGRRGGQDVLERNLLNQIPNQPSLKDQHPEKLPLVLSSIADTRSDAEETRAGGKRNMLSA